MDWVEFTSHEPKLGQAQHYSPFVFSGWFNLGIGVQTNTVFLHYGPFWFDHIVGVWLFGIFWIPSIIKTRVIDHIKTVLFWLRKNKNNKAWFNLWSSSPSPSPKPIKINNKSRLLKETTNLKKSLSLGLDHGELRKKITRKKVKTGEMGINLNDFFILKKLLYIYIYI